LKGIEEDFFETLYKIFGAIVGNRLGGFLLYLKEKNTKDEILGQAESILESGV